MLNSWKFSSFFSKWVKRNEVKQTSGRSNGKVEIAEQKKTNRASQVEIRLDITEFAGKLPYSISLFSIGAYSLWKRF